MTHTPDKPANSSNMPTIERSTLVERIVTAVIEYLSVSGLRSTDKLPSEKELAEMLGVGRIALREALVRLRAHGAGARKGAGQKPPSHRSSRK